MKQKAEVHCAVKLHKAESRCALCCQVTWSRKQRCTVLSRYMEQKAEVHCSITLHGAEAELHCAVTLHVEESKDAL